MNNATQPRTATAEPYDDAYALAGRTLVRERIRGMRKVIGRRLAPGDIVLRKAAPEVRQHLFEEACELYWNEMSWEEITDEELMGDEELTEMIFPGLLALIDAFLPRAPNGEPDRDREHREVVHDFLDWLAVRLVKLREARPDSEDERARILRQKDVTDDLIDIIAFRMCSLSNDEIDTYQNA
ncbi:hypothetical protein [Candidatus Palauibacter sp.]|uniref:hypothetical protein n=1 Tax=Candidatus Palauibacter sp. TaxID=3101350 RepID=UPI003B5C6694